MDQVEQFNVPPSVPVLANSSPLVPPTPRQQVRTHLVPYEPTARDYSSRPSTQIPPASSSLPFQNRTYPSPNEGKTVDPVLPQTSGSVPSVIMPPMVPPTPKPQPRTHELPSTTEPTNAYTGRRASEALPSSSIQPQVLQTVPSAPRPEMRINVPVIEPKSEDKAAPKAPEIMSSYPIHQVIPPTPRIQPTTFPPPTDSKPNGIPLRPFDAPITTTVLSAVPPTPKIQPTLFPSSADLNGTGHAFPSRLPITELSGSNPAPNQEQTDPPFRREIVSVLQSLTTVMHSCCFSESSENPTSSC